MYTVKIFFSNSSKSIDSNMEAAINMWSFTEKVVKSESLKKASMLTNWIQVDTKSVYFEGLNFK